MLGTVALDYVLGTVALDYVLGTVALDYVLGTGVLGELYTRRLPPPPSPHSQKPLGAS